LTNNGDVTTLTWKQRFLIDASSYDPTDKDAPILFYAGNEGNIMNFYDNTGFMWENIAPATKGLVIFGEHRYFGESWPFGTPEESFKTENLKYLTTE